MGQAEDRRQAEIVFALLGQKWNPTSRRLLKLLGIKKATLWGGLAGRPQAVHSLWETLVSDE